MRSYFHNFAINPNVHPPRIAMDAAIAASAIPRPFGHKIETGPTPLGNDGKLSGISGRKRLLLPKLSAVLHPMGVKFAISDEVGGKGTSSLIAASLFTMCPGLKVSA